MHAESTINSTKGAYHSDINTRAEFKTELPDFYQLLAEILPENGGYEDCYRRP